MGLTGSAGDGARRAERFGTNRLASREEVTFAQMVLDALEVKPGAEPLVEAGTDRDCGGTLTRGNAGFSLIHRLP